MGGEGRDGGVRGGETTVVEGPVEAGLTTCDSDGVTGKEEVGVVAGKTAVLGSGLKADSRRRRTAGL